MTVEPCRAFWVAAPGRGEIRNEPLPQPGPGDILVRTLYSGISRGTEAIVFRGRVPASEHERMRAPYGGTGGGTGAFVSRGRVPAGEHEGMRAPSRAGASPGRVKSGYISVGRVEHGPPSPPGRHVFVFYPHQPGYVVPADAAYVI